MAMTTCRECATEVSGDAKTCPKCGVEKPGKRPNKTRGIFWLLIFAAIGVVIISSRNSETAVSSPAAAPATAAQSPIDPLFEKKKLAAAGAKMLMSSMRDPESFRLIRVVLGPKGAACYQYRARNGFGGYSVEEAVLGRRFLTGDMDGFENAWNSECAGKSLQNVTEDVAAILELAGTPLPSTK